MRCMRLLSLVWFSIHWPLPFLFCISIYSQIHKCILFTKREKHFGIYSTILYKCKHGLMFWECCFLLLSVCRRPLCTFVICALFFRLLLHCFALVWYSNIFCTLLSLLRLRLLLLSFAVFPYASVNCCFCNRILLLFQIDMVMMTSAKLLTNSFACIYIQRPYRLTTISFWEEETKSIAYLHTCWLVFIFPSTNCFSCRFRLYNCTNL